MARRKYTEATKDARGNYWATYTDPDSGETRRVAVSGPQEDFEEGGTYYSPIGKDQIESVARGNLQEGILGEDAYRWAPGSVISPEEFNSFYQRLSDPRFYNEVEGLTPQSLVNDPRSAVRMENGQYVYRPDQMQGDFTAKETSPGGFGNLLKGFLTSPGVGLASIPFGSYAWNAISGAPIASAMGSGTFPTFMGEAASSIAPAASAGANLPANYWNMVADASTTMTDAAPGLLESSLPEISGDMLWETSGSLADLANPSLWETIKQWAPVASAANGVASLAEGLTQSPAPVEAIDPATGRRIPFDESTGLPSAFRQAATGNNLGALVDTAGRVLSAAQSLGGKNETPAETISRLLKEYAGFDISPSTLGLAGTLGATGLGAYGANQQAKSAESLYNRYLDMGAPYRTGLQSLVQDPESFYKSPVVQGALQQGTDALARSLSAKVGNPILNPTAVGQMQNYTTRGLLDAYNTQFRNLAAAGGLGVDESAGLGLNASRLQGQPLNAYGAGLASLLNNQRDYAGEIVDMMRRSQRPGSVPLL